MQAQVRTVFRSRRLRVTFVISALVALVAAVASVCELGLLPPKLEPRPLQTGAAATQAMVDYPQAEKSGRTPVAELSRGVDVLALSDRARPLAQTMASAPVLARIGRRIGVDPGSISATPQMPDSVPRVMIEPDAEQRANGILAASAPYRLEVRAKDGFPVLDLYARAPSAGEAERLADASIAGLNAELRHLARERALPATDLVRLTQLGAARGGPVDSTAPMMIAGLTFLVVFGVSWGLLALLGAVVRGWQRSASGARTPATSAVAHSPELGGDAVGRDDWPHTTRVLPWMIAGFIALIWLVPFNTVGLDASLPIDLKLDRLVLPAIVFVWVFALAVGGRFAPRWRFTPIHAGIAAFAAAAALSVVFNAGELDRILVLGLSIKKLSLLAAYVMLFLVVASAVRPREVRAFMTLILALASICALGMLWEYRFHFNVFYEAMLRVLPGFFDVPTTWGGVDELGRLSVIGPTEVGLEAVAILSMALPIALVGLVGAKRGRDRLIYGLAVCVLGAAILATYRKSALVAPLAVCATLAYLRPRAALKLAPLGAVAIVVLSLLSFQAFDSIAGQFSSDHLDVGTVSDRVSDYDAVRPNVLSHPAFGLGFGSYEHTYAPDDYRILDSELLSQLVTTGAVGLVAFLAMIGTVIACAVRISRTQHRRRANSALAIAAAAVAFLALTALFDEWGFPHAAYLFLTFAGLLAAMVGSREGDRSSSPGPALTVARPEAVEAPAATNGAARTPTPV